VPNKHRWMAETGTKHNPGDHSHHHSHQGTYGHFVDI
jgi:hypothetical protein